MLAVLHLSLDITAGSIWYNEYVLPQAEAQAISACCYFKPEIAPSPRIRLFAGDGTLGGFFRALGAALDQHDYDIIHVHSPHLGSFLVLTELLRRRRVQAATVYTVHSSFAHYKPRNKLLLLPVLARFDRIVCCSRASLASLPAVVRRVLGRQLTVIQNGVNLARVDEALAGWQPERSGSSFEIVAVCRLEPIKNIFTVLDAFQRSQDASSTLTFIGDGQLRGALERRIEAGGLRERVRLTGIIGREEVYRRLRAADLFISASKGEGLPVAVLEAMACRCPVLLSDIAPHREVVGEVDCIALVAPDDGAGFAREIERWRERSAAERAECGGRGREQVERHFALTRLHQEYRQVYSELLEEREGRKR
jgi:glycosyltransferase involved in cell wall biosynthesis